MSRNPCDRPHNFTLSFLYLVTPFQPDHLVTLLYSQLVDTWHQRSDSSSRAKVGVHNTFFFFLNSWPTLKIQTPRRWCGASSLPRINKWWSNRKIYLVAQDLCTSGVSHFRLVLLLSVWLCPSLPWSTYVSSAGRSIFILWLGNACVVHSQ